MWMQNTFINCFELILTMNKLQYNCKQNERGKKRKFVKKLPQGKGKPKTK